MSEHDRPLIGSETFNEEIPMIGYVVLGTNDLDRAASFYDDLLAEMGGLRAAGGEGFYTAYFRDLDGNKLDVFSYG